jgi:hypothetical protein
MVCEEPVVNEGPKVKYGEPLTFNTIVAPFQPSPKESYKVIDPAQVFAEYETAFVAFDRPLAEHVVCRR